MAKLPTLTTLDEAVARLLTVRVSAMFGAILEYTLEAPVKNVSPQVLSLSITSDGFLMGWNTNRPDKEGLMGTASDLDRNLHGVCTACELSPELTEAVAAKVYAKISDWRHEGRKGASPYAGVNRG